MTRNGRRPRRTIEKLAADYDYLDVRKLQQSGLLTDNWIAWTPMLGLRGVVKIVSARHLILVELRPPLEPQQIRVSWTRCNFGGMRPWFHCPCGQRVTRLFKGLVGYYCRHCFDDPIYACQTKSTQGRRHFEACKLRLRLGGIASLDAPFPERPRGMHQKTYAGLRRRAEQLESRISERLRHKPADYPNLVYYLPPMTSK
jgi:hypothetical protein